MGIVSINDFAPRFSKSAISSVNESTLTFLLGATGLTMASSDCDSPNTAVEKIVKPEIKQAFHETW